MTHVEILDRLHPVVEAASKPFQHEAGYPARGILDMLSRKSPEQLQNLPRMNGKILREIDTYEATKEEGWESLGWLKDELNA